VRTATTVAAPRSARTRVTRIAASPPTSMIWQGRARRSATIAWVTAGSASQSSSPGTCA
jgi:hypothetical protein